MTVSTIPYKSENWQLSLGYHNHLNHEHQESLQNLLEYYTEILLLSTKV